MLARELEHQSRRRVLRLKLQGALNVERQDNMDTGTRKVFGKGCTTPELAPVTRAHLSFPWVTRQSYHYHFMVA